MSNFTILPAFVSDTSWSSERVNASRVEESIAIIETPTTFIELLKVHNEFYLRVFSCATTVKWNLEIFSIDFTDTRLEKMFVVEPTNE